MERLREDTLVVFVSDSHVGGDPGCDGFESPEQLAGLFAELGEREGPVELVLAGDFFDFLQIGSVPDGKDRASVTVSRPEYRGLFEALARFGRGDGKRVVYLPGNHDAEVWWNPRIREALRGRGLVDEFAFSYAAQLEAGGERWTVYCEHGNQFDPPNTVRDYGDALDTPLGHHVVTDFTRRIAPLGEVAPGLDLSDIKNVFPLAAIPRWVASRYFYGFLGKAVSRLLVPLVVAYAAYRVAVYSLLGGYRGLADARWLFAELAGFGVVTLLVFGLFVLAFRRETRRVLARAGPTPRPRYSPAEASWKKIEALLEGGSAPPMDTTVDPADVDVFVSGHTHLPSLEELERPGGGRRVVANSGCWLRQVRPASAHLRGPPVFVSTFVLTHVRVFAEASGLRVELWEQPRPAQQRLTRAERLLSLGRRPPQPLPGARSRLQAPSTLERRPEKGR